MSKNYTWLFLLLVLFGTSARSQTSTAPQTVNVSGGYNDNPSSYYRYEWSVGEASVIETFSSPTLVVTAGVLQPGTNNPASDNTNQEWGTEEIKIYPNPVITELEISILSKQKGKISMILYDATGRQIGNRQFDYYGTGRIEKWNFSRLATGQYLLKIILDPQPGSVPKKGTFKVQKLKN